jgi:hypothetical protein
MDWGGKKNGLSPSLRRSPAMSRGASNRCGTTEVAAAWQATTSERACEQKRGRTRAAALGRKGGREREGQWGQKDKKEVKWPPTDPVVVGQISIEIERAALPYPRGGTAALPKQRRFSYRLCDSLYLRYGHISSIYHDQRHNNHTNHGHAT